ncbi:hypothetical protein [Streptomyces sp. NPDC003393]
MTTTVYFQLANGAVGRLETEREDPDLPEGAELITQEEYEAAKAALEEAHAEHVASMEQELQEQAGTDYAALVGLGLPEETARRLSGYTPPEDGEQQ